VNKIYNINIYKKSIFDIERIIEDCIKRNISSVGFYLYTNNSLYTIPNEDEELFITKFNSYINSLNKLKQKYYDISIYFGIETNYEEEKYTLLKELREKVNYFILSDRYYDVKKTENYPLIYANYIKKSLNTGLFDMIKISDKYSGLKEIEKENNNDIIIANQIIIDAINDNNISIIYEKNSYVLSKKNNKDFWNILKKYNISVLSDKYAIIKNYKNNNIKNLHYETYLIRKYLDKISKLDFNKNIILDYINSSYINLKKENDEYIMINKLMNKSSLYKEINNVTLRQQNLLQILYYIVDISFGIGCINHKELKNICTLILEYNFCKDLETKTKILNSIITFVNTKNIEKYINIKNEITLPLVNDNKSRILSLKMQNGFISIFSIVMMIVIVCALSVTIACILFILK